MPLLPRRLQKHHDQRRREQRRHRLLPGLLMKALTPTLPSRVTGRLWGAERGHSCPPNIAARRKRTRMSALRPLVADRLPWPKLGPVLLALGLLFLDARAQTPL